MDLAFTVLKFFMLLVALATIPVGLIVTTPFVLGWPRTDRTEPYRCSVWRRYRTVFRFLAAFANIGGALVD